MRVSPGECVAWRWQAARSAGRCPPPCALGTSSEPRLPRSGGEGRATRRSSSTPAAAEGAAEQQQQQQSPALAHLHVRKRQQREVNAMLAVIGRFKASGRIQVDDPEDQAKVMGHLNAHPET